MRKFAFAALALAAGFMVQGLTPTAANALPVSKGNIAAKHEGVTQVRHGGRHFSGRHFGGHRFHGGRHFGHHRWHRRHFYGPRIYFGPTYRYGYYGGSCYWLKRRAIHTGSSYWWRRYWRCRNGW